MSRAPTGPRPKRPSRPSTRLPTASSSSIRFTRECLDMAASFPGDRRLLAQTVRATPGGGTMDGPRAGRLLALAALELALDPVELRRRAVQAPAVADERDRCCQADPDRPERALRAGRQPDHGADQERAQQPAGLLQQAPLELAASLRQRGSLPRARGGGRRPGRPPAPRAPPPGRAGGGTGPP